MITRNLIDITNHPDLENVTRKAQVFRAYNEYDTNRVIIPVKIFHYIDGIEVSYFPDTVELISDNDTRVNPANGQIVEAVKDADGNYPSNTIGEFDYLWNLVNVFKMFTQIQLEEMYISLRIDKLNKKLYNK